MLLNFSGLRRKRFEKFDKKKEGCVYFRPCLEWAGAFPVLADNYYVEDVDVIVSVEVVVLDSYITLGISAVAIVRIGTRMSTHPI